MNDLINCHRVSYNKLITNKLITNPLVTNKIQPQIIILIYLIKVILYFPKANQNVVIAIDSLYCEIHMDNHVCL
jgi:hypothetical protein